MGKKDITRAALYLRVSDPRRQTARNQERDLRPAAARHGWQVVSVFKDGIQRTTTQRPGLKALLEGAARREFTRVLVWRVDRLGSSMPLLVHVLGELQAKSIELYSHREGIDTATPMGKAFYYHAGIFAGVEHEAIVDRIHAGLRRARAEGTKFGRPPIKPELEAQIRHNLSNQGSIRKTAARVGVAPGPVQRVRDAMRKAGELPMTT